MTTIKTITGKLRALMMTGAVGLLPSVAFAGGGSDSNSAGTSEGVADHAAAEARSVGETSTSSPEAPSGIPDHATAEARSTGETAPPRERTTPPVPDHATAEARGAEGE